MKFSIFGFAVATRFASVSGQTCQSLCDGLTDCRNDPHAHGSYCKSWNDPEVCFGLYWTDASETQMCFQPNSSVPCPENRPVRCPPITDRCQAICDATPGCRNDPHAHGSYCKSWQHVPVCFGLYWTDATRTATCFEPNDPSCSEEFPVECSAGAATTAAPTGATTTAAGSTTVAPTTTAAVATTPVVAGLRQRPTVGASAVTAPPATTPAPTTAAPATTARPAGLSGTYRGNYANMISDLTVTFTSSSTVDISLTAFRQTFPGRNINYRMNGNNVELINDAALTAFLAVFPLRVAPESIVITYEPSTDVLTGTFMGMSVRGTRV